MSKTLLVEVNASKALKTERLKKWQMFIYIYIYIYIYKVRIVHLEVKLQKEDSL